MQQGKCLWCHNIEQLLLPPSTRAWAYHCSNSYNEHDLANFYSRCGIPSNSYIELGQYANNNLIKNLVRVAKNNLGEYGTCINSIHTWKRHSIVLVALCWCLAHKRSFFTATTWFPHSSHRIDLHASNHAPVVIELLTKTITRVWLVLVWPAGHSWGTDHIMGKHVHYPNPIV